jgi:photosystem II stability/assembly factor-like uncharacterized protein
MKNKAAKFIIGILVLCVAAGIGIWVQSWPNKDQRIMTAAQKASKGLRQSQKEHGKKEAAEERAQIEARHHYFFRMLRDPATNTIPRNIRAHAVNHARKMHAQYLLKVRSNIAGVAAKTPGFTWKLAGPDAVGGRTRALGIDQRNPDIIIAGAVSGGIWKSTDGGNTWQMKTEDIDSYSVTSLAQDPTHPDTWYYSAGELLGNSASSSFGRHSIAPYFGTGIFKSTNNGETWNRIPSTQDTDTQFDSQYDFMERIRISPKTGTVFFASDGFGIFRVANGHFPKPGDVSDLAVGGVGEHEYADVAVASDGTVAAALSSVNAGQSGGTPGIFVSHDDGKTWNNITPSSFPTHYARSVLAFAPSNSDILYDFTLKTGSDTTSNQGVSFYKLNLAKNPQKAKDRAGNLPDFSGYVGGISPQGGYNMVVAVKPDDPNFVIVGTVDLFRSTDGFATAPTGTSDVIKDKYWIGGYAKNATDDDALEYPNQHPDEHILVFDPNDPDILYSGNDGGIQVTKNVTASSVKWKNLDKGYITTQFYDASINPAAGGNHFLGGTQDNGTPFFIFNGNLGNEEPAADISSGDGGFSFFTQHYLYVSLARSVNNHPILRYNSNFSGTYNFVQPKGAKVPLFIDPYAVDPNHEGTMYFAADNDLYRNTEVDKISNQDFKGTNQGWSVINNASLSGYLISAVSVSTVPANILYYAGSSTNRKPVIMRLTNARKSNNKPEDISIKNAPNGAYLHDLAINPANGNELVAVMTNYDIVGLYHTMDGGQAWTAVEGNLTGNNNPASQDPGPSIRAATIIPAKSGTIYLVGTSTGVYSTRNLDGQNTNWVQVSAANNSNEPAIGYSVAEDITSRLSDGDVAVGTHGRGMFVGRFQGKTVSKNIPIISIKPTKGRAGDKVTITAQNFMFSGTPVVTFAGVPADVVNVTSSQITAIVPRATLSPATSDRTVTVKVAREKGSNPAGISFKILPPQKNMMKQNFPNPFAAGTGTQIPISLRRESNITVIIYNINGQVVDQPIINKKYEAGTYNISVNFNGKASGIYIYRIIAKPTKPGSKPFVKAMKFTYIK